jgi:hypothetical protein
VTEQEVIADIRSHYSDDDKSHFDVVDSIWRHGSAIEAIMYSALFWPEISETLGFVLLKNRIDTEEAKTRLSKAISENMDLSEVEESFNLVELPSDIFSRLQDTTDEQVEHLAGCLVEMWRAKLQLAYPNREFVVRVLSPNETGGEVGITFSQKRSASRSGRG